MSGKMEISKTQLAVSAGMIAALAVLITAFSVHHAQHMRGPYIQYPLFLYGTAIIALITGGTIVYLFSNKINGEQLAKILSILPRDERKVLRVLIERKEIEQKKLGTLAGLSRVKISRILSVFEQRRIIEKKKQGYTNLIILKM